MLHESAVQALNRLVAKNPRRYGGYVIHLGVVLMFIGVAGSSFFKVEKQISLKPGESFRYTSGCPLETPSGIMVGSYRMTTEDGEQFNVDIPAFSLDSPHAKRSLN